MAHGARVTHPRKRVVLSGNSEVVAHVESSRLSRLGSNADSVLFVDRAERQDVSFPLLFTSGDGEMVPGTCDNLSESGLLATFTLPLDIWTHGKVNLSFGAGLLGVHVRVACARPLRGTCIPRAGQRAPAEDPRTGGSGARDGLLARPPVTHLHTCGKGRLSPAKLFLLDLH